jgi:hypothetical protein
VNTSNSDPQSFHHSLLVEVGYLRWDHFSEVGGVAADLTEARETASDPFPAAPEGGGGPDLTGIDDGKGSLSLLHLTETSPSQARAGGDDGKGSVCC